MAKTTGLIPFNGTREQENELNEIMKAHSDDKGALMPVLQKAQEIYGYLPIEVQTMIACGLNIPLEEVYGVVTFYSQFSLYPKGEYKISVCLGTACYVKGSGDVFDKFARILNIKSGECTEDGRYSLDACRCIGACGLAPVLTVNDEVFGKVTVDDVDKILAKFSK
ncbi:MAG: NAD(P)H-dependent oxidoreductase subunit E [Oscillospiraceae bacterium]